MSSRSEQHAFFIQQVLEQVHRMVMGDIHMVGIRTPPGIGTISKILDFLDLGKCTNVRVRCSNLTERSEFENGLAFHLRQFQVVIIDEYDLLSAEMRSQVDWAVRFHKGGVIKISQMPRGLVIGEIGVS